MPKKASDAHSSLVARLPAEERPRERLFRFGPACLSEIELIALILGGGHALRRAAELVEHVGGLSGLARTLPHALLELPGTKCARAAALAASVELSRRLMVARLSDAPTLEGTAEAAVYVRAKLLGATQETFLVVGLDTRQKIRLVRTVALGSLSQVDVHPRELFRPLVVAGVHSCVLAHNHPSGDPTPSEADLILTQRMSEVGKLLGVPVLDHLVVADGHCVSFRDLGLLEDLIAPP
jgi:DNA repair protein RadC